MWWWGKLALRGLCLVALSGCGYTLQHRLKDTFTSSRGIFVPVFTNLTEETGAERVFTNALIREMESHGDVTLSSREAGALELRGTITGISYSASALSDLGFKGLQPYRRIPLELAINVAVSLELVDPRTGQVLWNGSFSGFRRAETPLNRTFEFEAPSSVGLQTQSIIESKYGDIARDIMRDVYDNLVELF